MVRSLIFSIFLFCVFLCADDATVSQSGNIVQIKSKKFGDYILLGDPTFHLLSNYQFEIELKPEKAESELKAETTEQIPPVSQDINDLLQKINKLYNQKKYKEALGLVENALQIQPDSARALAMRGSLKMVLGDKEDAQRDWEKALQAKSLEPSLKEKLEKNLLRAK